MDAFAFCRETTTNQSLFPALHCSTIYILQSTAYPTSARSTPVHRPQWRSHLTMQSVDERIRSFAAITKPKSAARPGWPLSPTTHPALTPKNLARAGYYYAPTSDSPDTCVCFSCGEALGGWEETDDPYDEQWRRRERCAWAEYVCGMYREKRDRHRP